MKNEPPCRLLILGGEKKHLPLEQLYKADRLGLLSWEHRSGLKKSKLTFGTKNIPTIVFIRSDFIGHGAESKILPKLKMLGASIVRTTGGFPNFLKEAEKKGHDYLVKILTNGEAEPPPKKSDTLAVGLRPSGEAPFIKIATIGGDDDPKEFRVTQKKGVLRLIVKGDLLDEVDAYARAHGLGKGKRGGLLPTEAKELVEYLEIKYGFSQYGILVNLPGIQKNVNLIRGALTPKAVAAASRKGSKAVKKERSERREQISGEVETGLGLKDGRVKGKAVEIFLADIAETMKILVKFPDKYENLFGRILDLEEKNRLVGDENEQLKKDLKEMKSDRDKWKKIATDERPG